MHSLKRPLFSVGIHLNSDTGTRSQRGQDQFERVRPRVFATDLARFVRLEHMRVDGYVLDKSQRSGICRYISRHISSLSYCYVLHHRVAFWRIHLPWSFSSRSPCIGTFTFVAIRNSPFSCVSSIGQWMSDSVAFIDTQSFESNHGAPIVRFARP